MQHSRLLRLALTGLAVALMVGLGFAQENLAERGATSLIIDVPFSFQVGDTMVPAGTYEIYRVNEWDFAIATPKRQKVVANFVTEPIDMAQQPVRGRAVFDVIGDKYFLSDVWFAQEAYGYHLPIPKAERALLKVGQPVQNKEVPPAK